MDFPQTVPPGQVSASEILVEALENVQHRNIQKVIVMCFDNKGKVVGWLSNVGDHIQRLGLIESMKAEIIEDKD